MCFYDADIHTHLDAKANNPFAPTGWTLHLPGTLKYCLNRLSHCQPTVRSLIWVGFTKWCTEVLKLFFLLLFWNERHELLSQTLNDNLKVPCMDPHSNVLPNHWDKRNGRYNLFSIKLQDDKDSITAFLVFLNLCCAPVWRHQEFQMALTIAESAENGVVMGLFNLWEKWWINYCMEPVRSSEKDHSFSCTVSWLQLLSGGMKVLPSLNSCSSKYILLMIACQLQSSMYPYRLH